METAADADDVACGAERAYRTNVRNPCVRALV